VHIVRGKRGAEEAHDELAHLVGIERLPGLDGGTTRIRRGESFEPVLPPAKPAAGEIGDKLLQAPRRLETWVGIRRRVDDDAAAGERLDFVPDAREQLAMRLDRIELGGGKVERQGQEQALRRRAIAGKLTHHVFVQHALVGECWSTIATPESVWKRM